MSIIVEDDTTPIRLTKTQYNRYLQEYSDAFRMYAGPRPDFEEWLRSALQKESHVTENTKQLLNG